MEGAELGLFMISAGCFVTLLEHPGSPVRQAIPDPFVRRMLIGLEASGIEDIRIMPDTFGIGRQAVHDLQRHHPEIADKVSLLDMEITGSAFDTTRAARLLSGISPRRCSRKTP